MSLNEADRRRRMEVDGRWRDFEVRAQTLAVGLAESVLEKRTQKDSRAG
jgi:hypothetical protein